MININELRKLIKGSFVINREIGEWFNEHSNKNETNRYKIKHSIIAFYTVCNYNNRQPDTLFSNDDFAKLNKSLAKLDKNQLQDEMKKLLDMVALILFGKTMDDTDNTTDNAVEFYDIEKQENYLVYFIPNIINPKKRWTIYKDGTEFLEIL